jgi:glycosyltransferase involved in cell wall biosynthesis
VEDGGATGADVLVVSPHMPKFDQQAGWLRLYLILQILARRYRVRFLGRMDADTRSQRYLTALQELGIDVRVAPQVDVADILEDVNLCVFFEFFTTAERALARVRIRRPDLPVVVDTVDVHFVRELRALKYLQPSWLARRRAERTKKRELQVYQGTDLIVTVTENDRTEILRELPEARVTVVPLIHEAQDTVPGFHERRRNSLLFVGGFSHSPNVDAVLFFCRDVLPHVKRALPDVEVTIVGDQPPEAITQLGRDDVVIAGWVPELSSLLDSHRVSIAPLRFGAGMKGKIAEAMAAGLPVVTTSIGAEGMDLEHGETALIADSAEAFAEAVVQLCSDAHLHRRLSESGRLHARRRWGLAPVERKLIEAIEGLRALKPKRLQGREWIAARIRDAFVRSGLAKRSTRAAAVTSWYGGKLLRMLRKR